MVAGQIVEKDAKLMVVVAMKMEVHDLFFVHMLATSELARPKAGVQPCLCRAVVLNEYVTRIHPYVHSVLAYQSHSVSINYGRWWSRPR